MATNNMVLQLTGKGLEQFVPNYDENGDWFCREHCARAMGSGPRAPDPGPGPPGPRASGPRALAPTRAQAWAPCPGSGLGPQEGEAS